MTLHSKVEIEIHAPQARVADLFADPSLGTEWMDDLARYELLSGDAGMPGSKYRLVPKEGDITFVATVIARDLPREVRLRLESDRADVDVVARFVALAPDRTRLVSEETFEFKGALGAMGGFLMKRTLQDAHRRHMESFRRFAESRAR